MSSIRHEREPEGRYLAGFDPDVVDPAGDWQGRSSWSRTGDNAIGFSGRGEAGACCHAAPAGALLRPGGTPGRPLSEGSDGIRAVIPIESEH